MTVVVAFIKPGGIGNDAAPGVAECRVSEQITVPGTTTAAAEDGEYVLIVSGEANVIRCAHGKSPDAAATAETHDTTAGYPIPPLQSCAVAVKTGDKVSLKALS